METQPEPNPPGEDVPPLLGSFLSERRDFVTARWIEAVRRNKTLEAAKQVNDVELADHLPKLFDDLAATLQGKPAAKEVKSDAEAHGDHRWRQHYGLEEVLEELGIVSRVLLAHGLDAFADAYPDTPKEQRRGARERILRFFEDTAAGSVRQYVERTSRQMREQDLALSEQRRLALDSAQMGWWQLDLASQQVACDERFKAIFGTDQEVVSYDWILATIHPDDRARVDASVQAAVRPVDPVPYAAEGRLVRADGSMRWVAAKGQAIFAGEGAERRPVSLAGTIADVTHEKEAAQALAASEAKYRSLFDSIDQGYCIIEVLFDESGQPVDYLFLEVNPAFEGHTGLKDIVGKRMRELAPSHESDWFKIYGRVAATGLPTRFEAEAAALGRWYDVYASRVDGASEHHVAVVFTDITARRAEEAALQASEARSAFLIQLSDALRPLSDPGEVQRAAARTLGERLGVNRVAYFEIDAGDYVVDEDYAHGVASFVGRHPVAAFGSLILDQLIKGQIVAEADTSATARRSVAERAAFASLSIRAIATFPLVKEGRFVAGLTAHTQEPRAWSAEDLWAIGETAERTWAAVERARAERALRAKEAASRFLADLGEATRQTSDPDAVLSIVVDALRAHLAADRCAYAEVEEDQDTITIRYDRADVAGSNRSLVGQYLLSDFGQGMLPTLRSGQTVVIADIATDPLAADAKEAMAAVGVAAVVNVPLVKAGRLVAVLAVHELRPRQWTADEVALIEAVAERSWGEVERSRAARALAESENRFRHLADVMPQIVWAARPDGYLSYYNRGWYDYTGADPDTFGDESWAGILHPDDLPQFRETWRQLIANGQPWETEFRFRRASDGTYRYFLGRGLPIKDADGKILRWIGTSTDVHESKQLAQQNVQLLESERVARSEAERISRVKDEFLATLSHELRTPLNAILGWTQVLRGDPANTADMEAGLATIERNSRAQTQIIEDLLDMSKIISGKVRLDVQPLHLDQVVAAAADTMRPAAAAKQVRLQALIDPEARMISGDPNRLQQVFWNLLSNAIKFTPKDGKVQVILERVNSHLEVSVADSGEGIAPEFLPYVFDRFRQQDASTTRRHGGLGLGLAIVKQLVELHGGSIQVESAGPGRGTTFKVLLPLSVVQPAPDPADSERRHPRSGGSLPSIPSDRLNLAGVNVLVVDDEADARALVQRLLGDHGAIVQAAGSAAEALGVLRSQRPDVLVSDIGMPEEDGYVFIRQVRALTAEQGGQTPAIALTAYARCEDRLKVILAGFQTHMAKPVEAAELLALVASLAGRVAGMEDGHAPSP